jgi:hypothetical protein
MPKVAELEAASLYIYADDHHPPHFHVRGPDSDANFYIHNCEMYVGEVTRKGDERGPGLVLSVRKPKAP